MSIANALALTALVPLLAAMIFSYNSSGTSTIRGERVCIALGWAALTLSLALFVAAIWTEVLT